MKLIKNNTNNIVETASNFLKLLEKIKISKNPNLNFTQHQDLF